MMLNRILLLLGVGWLLSQRSATGTRGQSQGRLPTPQELSPGTNAFIGGSYMVSGAARRKLVLPNTESGVFKLVGIETSDSTTGKYRSAVLMADNGFDIYYADFADFESLLSKGEITLVEMELGDIGL